MSTHMQMKSTPHTAKVMSPGFTEGNTIGQTCPQPPLLETPLGSDCTMLVLSDGLYKMSHE